MTEEERIKAIPILNDWKRMDDTVKQMVQIILMAENQPTVGHLARFAPDQFDLLYEESAAIMENPD
jgi:hypothetical protein